MLNADRLIKKVCYYIDPENGDIDTTGECRLALAALECGEFLRQIGEVDQDVVEEAYGYFEMKLRDPALIDTEND